MLSAYAYTHSVINYEICDSTDMYINSRSKFNSYQALINDTNAETCFFDNGRLDEKFELVFYLRVFCYHYIIYYYKFISLYNLEY